MTVTDGRLSWGKHAGTITTYVPRADDIGDVVWYGTRAAAVAVARAAQTATVATVAGHYGCGKTFAVARACEAYVANLDPDAQVSYIRGSGLGRGRQIYEGIFVELSGSPLPARWPATQIREEIGRHVQERRCLIVVDEAQRLTRSAQEALQEVSDLANVGTGIVLIGDESLEQGLIGELKRRRLRDCAVRLSPLDQESVPDVVRQLHPVLEATSEDVLRELNVRASGLLSRWAEIVGNVFHYGIDAKGPITSEDFPLLVGTQ